MGSSCQTQFWINFSTIKRNALYINLYHAKVEGTDRALSILSAVAASTSIAGWAIWQDFSFVWAMVIAASQVLAAVKTFLPYKARLKSLSTLGPELDGLALVAEEEWFAVSRGMLDDEQIHKLTMSLKRKCQQVTQRAFKGSSLPANKKLEALAERDALAYMATMSGGDDD